MEDTYKGIPVSPGVTIGRVFVLDDVRTRIPRRVVSADGGAREAERLREAIEASQQELTGIRAQAEEDLGTEAAKIFAFHQGMLADKHLTEPMFKRIENERVVAEYAVQEQFRVLAEMFSSKGDSAFRTKVDDVWDLERRVLRHLIGEHVSGIARLSEAAVVVAHDLTPSQAASLPRDKVMGFVTETGGPTSHTAIFARAIGIPAVVGAEGVSDGIEEGDLVVVDGDTGMIVAQPSEETIEQYRGYIKQGEEDLLKLEELSELASETKDGVRIGLFGNIEFPEEAEIVGRNGGDGIGLYRTEFLWLTSDHEPTEEEQYEAFAKCVDMSEGRPVTIRTYDLGADKYTQERALNPERNPFLGCRSIRYCLQNLGMFKRHLRAILRASAHGPVKIMFPLITNVMELRQARMVLKDVMEDLSEEGIAYDKDVDVGMMVETPAAALMAASYAREAAFFSIGTNDLVQYVLAVDRTNERVANLYSPAHPAVLRMIKDVVRAGRRREVPVSICGEVAGETLYTMLLMGLGLRSLSVTPSRIPYLKRVVRSVDIGSCERLARTACSFDSDRQVTAYLRDQARKIIPDVVGGRAAESDWF